MSHEWYVMSLLICKKPYLVLLVLFSAVVSAQENLVVSNYASLFKLSLQEILAMRVEIGNLSATALSKSPAAITIINREQIERTPARNPLDLLEVYVPGMMMVSHFTAGPRLRMRGLGERHFHTLLLVNGRPINDKAHEGSMVELRNWDMADIERIEVVRGPGSVTHGPGAIAGVINIITRKAQAAEELAVTLDYNPTYKSRALKLSRTGEVAGVDSFLHLSYTRTEGADHDIYQMLGNNGLQGYKGTADFPSGSNESNPLQGYYADYQGKPQIKLFWDMNVSEAWRFWLRFNNSGQTDTHVKKEFTSGFEDFRIFNSRYYILSLDNNHTLSDLISFKGRLSVSSQELIETKAKVLTLDHQSKLHRNYGYAVDEVNFRSTVNVTPFEGLSWATGLELSQDTIGAPWGESSSNFLARAGKQSFIVKGSIFDGGETGGNGTIKSGDVAEYTSGWSTNTYSLSTELKYQMLESLQLTASGRVDKNDQTKNMYSPRVALLYELDDENILKVSWQKSVRMNTMLELHWLELNDREQDPEHTSTSEISFSRLQNENLHLSITAYFNDSEIYSWDGSNVNLVGTIEAYGLEPELAWRTDTFALGVNHSYFELLDWNFLLESADGSVDQGVSYSDTFVIKEYLTRTDTGSSLTDWVNQHTKLFFDMNINERWALHVDARIIWKYDYGEDLFEMYNNAFAQVDTSALSAEDLADYNEDKGWLEAFNQTIDDKDPYGKDIRLNASLTWDLPAWDASVMLYGQNLLNFTDNKRQKVNFATRTVPIVSWVEEPRVIGLRYSQKF